MTKKYRDDYKGKRFGRLLVTRFIPTDGHYPMWECLCDCGAVVTVWSQSLRRGMTQSCGCLNREINRNRGHHHSGGHGRKRSGAYSSWANMMMRSAWMSHPSKEFYGERGVTVCGRWHRFENFLSDMGDRPKERSLDRIDPFKGYEPSNCRWATTQQQSLNKRDTIRVKYKGRVIPAKLLSKELGLSHKAIRARASRRGNDYVAAFRSAGVEGVETCPAWPTREREAA